MMTVLNAGSLSFGSYQQVALDNMVKRAAGVVQKKQEALTEAYTRKSDALMKESDRLVKLTSNVKNAELAVGNGMDAIKEIQGLMDDMRGALGEIEKTGSDYYRKKYDEDLRKINSAADRYSSDFNPVGRVRNRSNWDPNDITYSSDYSGRETSLRGVYVGADFRIEDTNGTTWVPDLSSDTLSEYNSYNTQKPTDSDSTGRVTSTRTGITAVSAPDSDGNQTFTMIVNGKDVSVTGKLVKGGLGLTGKWNHNNLATSDDIRGALDELNAASVKLDSARAQLGSDSTTVKNDMAKIDKKQDALKQKNKDALYESLEGMTALQREYNQQVSAMKRNLEAMSAQQKSYLSVFASTLSNSSKNPLFVNMSA